MARNFIVFITCLIVGITALDNGLGKLPPMGWTTWCTDNDIVPCNNDFCSESEVKDVVDAMVSNGLLDLGYNYINLDDCWAGERDSNGQIQADPKRFPSGMKALADYIHSKGMKFGLYTDAGVKTCKYSRPGSFGYYKQDAQTYADWTMDFVKMDWCTAPRNLTAQELYSEMRDALNATGRPMFFALCEWGLYDVWEWAGDVGNSWRVGPDHLPLWWTPETSQDPGQGQGTANIIQHMAKLGKYAGPGGWNDPDFLLPGYFWMGEEDKKTEFAFWCMFAAPLVVATDVRNLDNKKVILNKEAIAVNQDPLGIPAVIRVNNTDGGQVFSRPLSNGDWAVIIYNSNILWGDVNMSVEWTQKILPGWPAHVTKASVRDLWKHSDEGIMDTYTVKNLKPHASIMLRLKPVN